MIRGWWVGGKLELPIKSFSNSFMIKGRIILCFWGLTIRNFRRYSSVQRERESSRVAGAKTENGGPAWPLKRAKWMRGSIEGMSGRQRSSRESVFAKVLRALRRRTPWRISSREKVCCAISKEDWSRSESSIFWDAERIHNILYKLRNKDIAKFPGGTRSRQSCWSSQRSQAQEYLYTGEAAKLRLSNRFVEIS